VKRILHFLARTLHHDILLRKSSCLCLQAFANANWGLDVDNHKTTTRYILFLCQNSISWLSYKQKVVSKSNTETKYQSVVATLVDIK